MWPTYEIRPFDIMKRAIFLDRDGVLNLPIMKEGRPFAPRSFQDFKLGEGTEKVLRALKAAGFFLVVVTNQPDLARGFLPRAELEKMHAFLRKKLPLDDIRVCPHDDEDNCDCRKPRPGLLLAAASEYGIDLKNSCLIGDTWKDAEAGRRAGCAAILIDKPYNQGVAADSRVNNLAEAAKLLLRSFPSEAGSSTIKFIY